VIYTDVGKEVSAYRGEHFERMRIDEFREESEVFRWTREHGWEPAEAEADLHKSLARYVRRTPPLSPVAAPDAAEQERLRSLGYLPPVGKDDVSRAETALGLEAERRGDPVSAIAHYRKALQDNPGFLEATNNLAWLLATSRPDLRDPQAAIDLAETALAQDPGSPAVLDTLAAAYASADRLADAVRTQRQALASLTTSNPSVQADFRSRLDAYQEKLDAQPSPSD
jgi:tetratricopeptide (TPR) repeat protein